MRQLIRQGTFIETAIKGESILLGQQAAEQARIPTIVVRNIDGFLEAVEGPYQQYDRLALHTSATPDQLDIYHNHFAIYAINKSFPDADEY